MKRLKKNLVLALSFGISVYLVLALVSGLDDLENALSGFHWSLLAMAFGLLATSMLRGSPAGHTT